jgi:hypothetical protein
MNVAEGRTGAVPAAVRPSPRRADAAPPGRSRGVSRRRPWPTALLDAAILTAIVSVILVWLYKLWDASLGIPLYYTRDGTDVFAGGDATFHQAVVTALAHGSWWTTNSHLGAPFGQQLYDFPLGPDDMHVAILAVLARLTGNAFVAVNLYFLGCYVVVALVAWAVLRHFGLSRPTSIAIATLFAFAPFHQGQGEIHLFLAAYYAVPLGALLLNWQLNGFAAWGPARGAGGGGLTRKRLVAVILAGIVVGSASSYFAFFAVTLLGIVAVLQVAVRRSWRPLLPAALLAGTVSAALLANLAPAILYLHSHGSNINVARPAHDSWVYGMNIAQLVMPIQNHRIHAFAALAERTKLAGGFFEPGNSVGFVGLVALVGLALLLVRRVAGRPDPGTSGPGTSGPVSCGHVFRVRQGGLALLAALVATAGGLSLVIAVAGLVQVRVWARMAIYITFFALCAAGSWIDEGFRSHAAVRRLHRALPPFGGRQLRWAVAAALIVFGVLDQTVSTASPADYRATAATFSSDAQFGATLRNTMAPGSMIFQLPVIRFPESGLIHVNMYDYDLLKGYLHAPDLRWSYGSVKGRPEADWQLPLSSREPSALLVGLAAANFSGLYIDTAGYPDGGAGLVGSVQRLLEQAPLRSPDRRLLLFDLRPLRERLLNRFGAGDVDAVGTDLTSPRMPTFGTGFYPRDANDAALTNVVHRSHASSEMIFDTATPERLRLSFSVRSTSTGGELTLAVDGQETQVDARSGSAQVTLPLSLPPGRTVVNLSATFPRPVFVDELHPDARFVISDVTVISDLQTSLVDACRPPASGARLAC